MYCSNCGKNVHQMLLEDHWYKLSFLLIHLRNEGMITEESYEYYFSALMSFKAYATKDRDEFLDYLFKKERIENETDPK